MTRPMLSPEFAAQDSEAYKHGLITHLGSRAVHGNEMWQAGLNAGVQADQITIDPTTFKSSMTREGDMVLGAGDMPADVIAQREFLGPHETERTQADWAAWRLMHEAMHLGVHRLRGAPAVRSLLSAAISFRYQSNGLYGLTAVGSGKGYIGYKPEEKGEEDVVDLMTMVGWGGEPMVRSYAEMIEGGGRQHRKTRERLGLVHTDGARLYNKVGAAVQEVLAIQSSRQ